MAGAGPTPQAKFEALRDVYRNFSVADALKIKKIERTTNHDLKAVEYFIKDHFDAHGPWTHSFDRNTPWQCSTRARFSAITCARRGCEKRAACGQSKTGG